MKVRSLGQEDAVEEGVAACSSILAWRIPWSLCGSKALDATEVACTGSISTVCLQDHCMCLSGLFFQDLEQLSRTSRCPSYASVSAQSPYFTVQPSLKSS